MKIGLLTGLAFAVFKIVQARRPSPALPEGPDPWARRHEAPRPAEPELAPSVTPVPTPAGDGDRAPGGDVDGAGRLAPPPIPSAGAASATEAKATKARATKPRATRAKATKAKATKARSTSPSKGAPSRATAAKKAGAGAGTAWVAPDGSVCPSTHPVKAKLTSRIFHLPGMAAYERTSPDRCYRDEASAAADGLRKSKR